MQEEPIRNKSSWYWCQFSIRPFTTFISVLIKRKGRIYWEYVSTKENHRNKRIYTKNVLLQLSLQCRVGNRTKKLKKSSRKRRVIHCIYICVVLRYQPPMKFKTTAWNTCEMTDHTIHWCMNLVRRRYPKSFYLPSMAECH